jgi:hypothetical protein
MPKKKLLRKSLPKSAPSVSEFPQETQISCPEAPQSGTNKTEFCGDEVDTSLILATTDEEREHSSPPGLENVATAEIREVSSESDETDTRQRQILSSVVSEKRAFDFLVNKLTRRLEEVTASKKKGQNELVELKFSVVKLLKEIENIESDPHTHYRPSQVSKEGTRGPPLPSQEELFAQAWEKGQVSKTYSKFSRSSR